MSYGACRDVTAEPTLIIGLGEDGVRILRYLRWIVSAEGSSAFQAGFSRGVRLFAVDCGESAFSCETVVPRAVSAWRDRIGAPPGPLLLCEPPPHLHVNPVEAERYVAQLRLEMARRRADTAVPAAGGPWLRVPDWLPDLVDAPARPPGDCVGHGRITDRLTARLGLHRVVETAYRLLSKEVAALRGSACDASGRVRVLLVGALGDPLVSGTFWDFARLGHMAAECATVVGVFLVPDSSGKDGSADAAAHAHVALAELQSPEAERIFAGSGMTYPFVHRGGCAHTSLFGAVHLVEGSQFGADDASVDATAHLRCSRLAEAILAGIRESGCLKADESGRRGFSTFAAGMLRPRQLDGGIAPLRPAFYDALGEQYCNRHRIPAATHSVSGPEGGPPAHPFFRLSAWVEEFAADTAVPAGIVSWTARITGWLEARRSGNAVVADIDSLTGLFHQLLPAALAAKWTRRRFPSVPVPRDGRGGGGGSGYAAAGSFPVDPVALAADLVRDDFELAWADAVASMSGLIGSGIDSNASRAAHNELAWLNRLPNGPSAAEVAAALAPLVAIRAPLSASPSQLPLPVRWAQSLLRSLPHRIAEFSRRMEEVVAALAALGPLPKVVRRAAVLRLVAERADVLRRLLTELADEPRHPYLAAISAQLGEQAAMSETTDVSWVRVIDHALASVPAADRAWHARELARHAAEDLRTAPVTPSDSLVGTVGNPRWWAEVLRETADARSAPEASSGQFPFIRILAARLLMADGLPGQERPPFAVGDACLRAVACHFSGSAAVAEWRLGGRERVRSLLETAHEGLLSRAEATGDAAGRATVWLPRDIIDAPTMDGGASIRTVIGQDVVESVLGISRLDFKLGDPPAIAGWRWLGPLEAFAWYCLGRQRAAEWVADGRAALLTLHRGLAPWNTGDTGPRRVASCGNAGCDHDISGIDRRTLLCPHCDRPIYNRCGNPDCHEDHILDLVHRVPGATARDGCPHDFSVYVCPRCGGDLKTWWWFCPEKGHHEFAIAATLDTCPRCVEDYSAGRRPTYAVGHRPDVDRECPGCATQGLARKSRTRVPPDLVPFFECGVPPHRAADFQTALTLHRLQPFECSNKDRRHLLFPAYPPRIGGDGPRVHLHLARDGWLATSPTPAIVGGRFGYCFSCGFPIPPDGDGGGGHGARLTCPRCLQALRECPYCSVLDGALFTPEPAAGRGPRPFSRPVPAGEVTTAGVSRCPRCSNLMTSLQAWDADQAGVGLIELGACINVFGCRAAARPWTTAAEYRRGFCRACAVGGPTALVHVATLQTAVDVCPMCLMLVGSPNSARQTPGDVLGRMSSGSHPQPSDRPCVACGSVPTRILKWLQDTQADVASAHLRIAHALLDHVDPTSPRPFLQGEDLTMLDSLCDLFPPSSLSSAVLRKRER